MRVIQQPATLVYFRYPDCIPPPSRYFALCTVSIHAMSDFYPLETDLETVASYVSVSFVFHVFIIWFCERGLSAYM